MYGVVMVTDCLCCFGFGLFDDDFWLVVVWMVEGCCLGLIGLGLT